MEEENQDLAVEEELRLTEPTHDAEEAEACEAPPVAAATADPNRLTIYVPFDHTTFSMGQSGPVWIPDRGVTAKTDNHIHFFVVGKNSATDNTIVTLGSPATAHSVESHVGGLSSGTIHGYAMVTSGNAWHDSQLHQVMMSREQDVTVRSAGEGKAVGVQADTGRVLVFGGEAVTLGSAHGIKIGAHPDITSQNIGYETHWTDSWTENLGAKIGSTLDLAGELVTSLVAMAGSFRTGTKHANKGKTGWHAGALSSKPKKIADLTLFASTAIRGALEVAGIEPAGSVSVTAQKFAAMSAGIGATLYGQAASAVISLGQAEVLGGISALVKGLAYTEIAGGLLTAVSAIKDVEIAASTGEIAMTAKTEVAISSLTGEVLIGAEEAAQVTSMTKEVFLHGKTGAYIGAGSAGYAAEFKPDELKIGKAGSADKFTAPGFDNDCILQMDSNATMLKRGDSMLRLKPDGALLKGKKVNLHAESQNVQINGEKILIG